MKKILFLFCIFWGSCDVFDYHPYDVRITNDKYKNINSENIKKIEKKCSGKNTIRFVMVGDTQRWYDETEMFVNHINGRDDIDFVIHGGDVSDFGLKKEMEWVVDIMSKLKVPYVTLIGNHDILGNGLSVYRTIFGDLNFSFIAGRNHFVCLNTNALEFDYSVPVPDFLFIENEMAHSNADTIVRSVVAMHAQPFSEQFNNNVANVFQKYICSMKNMKFCLHAHGHTAGEKDLFGDGVIYYECGAMNDRNYLLFTLTDDSYTYEVVDF